MEVRQIREARILLPSDADDRLTPADRPPARGDLTDLRVQDADWSRLQATERDMSGCHLKGVTVAEAHLEDARLTNTVFDNCDFASARCLFRGCRLIGL